MTKDEEDGKETFQLKKIVGKKNWGLIPKIIYPPVEKKSKSWCKTIGAE